MAADGLDRSWDPLAAEIVKFARELRSRRGPSLRVRPSKSELHGRQWQMNEHYAGLIMVGTGILDIFGILD